MLEPAAETGAEASAAVVEEGEMEDYLEESEVDLLLTVTLSGIEGFDFSCSFSAFLIELTELNLSEGGSEDSFVCFEVIAVEEPRLFFTL